MLLFPVKNSISAWSLRGNFKILDGHYENGKDGTLYQMIVAMIENKKIATTNKMKVIINNV